MFEVPWSAPVVTSPALIAPPDFYAAGFQALGSSCRLSYRADSAASADDFLQAVTCWVGRFQVRYSRYGADSLTDRINRNAGGEWVAVEAEDEELFDLCERAFLLSRGCFDPSALPLIELWDYKSARTELPDADRVRECLSLVGWNRIERRKGAIRLPRKGMGIDLGGIGKEYAVDRVLEMARERGLEHILVDFGQDLRGLGGPPEGGPWRIGLEDPGEPGRCWSGVALDDCAIATSGDYARNFSLAGQRYGHIIDPRSGYPVANRCLAVSVIAPLCTEAGVLSTAAFILGAEAGLPFLESHPQAEGCIVSETGRRQTSNFHKFSL